MTSEPTQSVAPALYLIPVEIGDGPSDMSLPAGNQRIVSEIRTFIVENVRTARRFLRKWDSSFPIDDCEFFELNGHTSPEEVSGFLTPLRQERPVGVMSEAGCPAVADPGADVVAIAQREGLKVVPLVGPSSILMSLMASGFNGQGFAFNGYLPIKDDQRAHALKELEARCARLNQTQIFIETPYRNNRMISFLAEHLRPDTLLCVASDISSPGKETIVTRPASQWRNNNKDFDKRPAIFLIHCQNIADPAKRHDNHCRKRR
ncbi:MAG: SAM-dependent methyltransferase [Muribaculaceae bacterium]|nr:SAM-dependent methyltransferase [Muribaculaceae bacterium]